MIKQVSISVGNSNIGYDTATFVEIDAEGKYRVVKQFCKFLGREAVLRRAIAALNRGDDSVEIVRGSRDYSPISIKGV